MAISFNERETAEYEYTDDRLNAVCREFERADLAETEFERLVVKILKRHQIGTPEDIAYLEGLIS